MIQRWGTFGDLREGAGQPGEGTTIDTDEPFMLRLGPTVFIKSLDFY